MKRQQLRKSYELRIAGVLMMPAGIVRIIFGIYMLYLYSTMHVRGMIPDDQLVFACITFGVHAVCSLCELVGGFWGVINWDEPLLAYKSIRFGIVTLALGLIGNALQYWIGFGVSYVAWITGAAAPALFLIAAVWFWTHRMSI